MMELTAMEAGAGRDGTWRMEAAGGPEVTNSAVEASAASEVPTTVKSAAASEMSATAPMSTAPMPAAARRGGRSRRQGCAKSDHAKQFQSFHRFFSSYMMSATSRPLPDTHWPETCRRLHVCRMRARRLFNRPRMFQLRT
ncbi:hypothetical protein [Bradyrhizobium sp. MOS001]|uniref:hypothetical protein n=1 Tax=Bradyrhizobium sp. MOS001 TaxID=2133948 RepID=UPI001FCEEECD|nr:hypothetical protein [Bradyrhizobium sp. MOS001]